MLTKEQVIERTKTLGASEIPAILGLDEHKTLFKVWHSKLYPNTEPVEDTAQQSRGHFMEPTIARMYQRDHDGRMVNIWQKTIAHPSFDWLTATGDYISWLGSGHFSYGGGGEPLFSDDCRLRGLECKTAGHRYFDETECPKDYEAQARTQLACLPNLEAVDVAAMNAHAFAEGTPFYWEVLRDKEKERTILEAAEHFWFTYVVPKKEPPPDKSEEYASYCNVQPSKGKELELTGDETDEALQEMLVTLTEYRKITKDINKLEQDKDLLSNKARLVCRDYDVVKGPFGAYHYKQQADSEKIDWEQTARYLGLQHNVTPGEFEAFVKLHTRIVPGVRKPNPRWKK